ncbi:hypothetical protein ACPF7Z_17485 [Halomonas sp. GXIMD04776]|uniref:hypothetical protein n=1 Tax=Halomonas sp. GXIMD04776 TaxID=3415605 RepID=UPI003CA804EB
MSKIEYTQTFENQLHDHFNYLTRHIGQEAAKDMLEAFLDDFESRVSSHLERVPLCEEAADLGLTRYHDYVNAQLQLRAIYRLEEADRRILGMLFLGTRQSLRQALIQYCLRRE